MAVYNFHKQQPLCDNLTSSDKAINHLMDQNEAFDILDMTITIFLVSLWALQNREEYKVS